MLHSPNRLLRMNSANKNFSSGVPDDHISNEWGEVSRIGTLVTPVFAIDWRGEAYRTLEISSLVLFPNLAIV